MRLTPCPACARHVRSDAGICPFCDHALPAHSGARARVGAVLLGVATVSTLSACPQPRPATKYGGPPAPLEQPEALDSTPPADSPEPAEDEAPEAPEAPETGAPAPEEAPEA